MTDMIITFARVAVIGLMALLLIVVAMKIVWNFGLAYAMIREDARGVRRGWSAFPLIELVPLLGAVGLAFLVRPFGWLSPWKLLLWGLAVTAASSCHLVIVVMIYGFYRRRKSSTPTN